MKILSMAIIFISYMFVSSANWVVRKFGNVTYEQIMFHLKTPLDSETKLIISYLQNTVMMAVIVTIAAYILTIKMTKKKCFLFSLACLCGAFLLSWNTLNIGNLIDEYKNHKITGTFYEEHYVDSHQVKITAPAKKRNLIMIFAESMESTYANADYFGDNLIPHLQKYAEDNIHFSHNEGLGGFQNINGAKYTQASMVSQLCAIPLRLPVRAKRYRPKNGFLPGALCLGDILAENGYNQSFMIGMTKFFSGTDRYLETHGNQKVLDWEFYSVRDNLPDDTDEKRKRIVRDIDLFNYAKAEILELAGQNKPFSFTIMTMDTHFGDEHFEPKKCQIKYHDKKLKDKYNPKNVVSCSDLQISEFVEWIKSQPFYENTEVVIVGDHLTMSSTIFDDKVERTVYDVYMNSSIQDKSHTKNRQFTALDTLPTLLEGLGYTIEGHKLGLGVSLFSGEKTLLEQGISLDTLNTELDRQSKVYDKLLFGN